MLIGLRNGVIKMKIIPKVCTWINACRVTEDSIQDVTELLAVYDDKLALSIHLLSDVLMITSYSDAGHGSDLSEDGWVLTAYHPKQLNFTISDGDWLLIDGCCHLQQLTHEYVCANYTLTDGTTLT